MKFRKLFALPFSLLMGALLLSACGDDPAGPVDPTELRFATGLGVNLDEMTLTASGLYYQDEVVGEGAEVTPGSTVTVDYSGWLHNGQLFDSTVGDSPYTVQNIGNGNVIAGWNEGLIGMHVGGRRLLVIPSHLGYGKRGSGPIPPYATLVFRVTVRAVAN